MRVNNVAAIFVSILIFVASIAAVLFINLWEFSSKQDKNQVQYGVLDLSEESNIKLTNLNGSWEFYPGVFIDSPSESPIKPEYANVPGSLINMKEAQVGGGYAGTYRLVVKVPAQGAYGIKTGSIRTACRTFINGEEAFVIGKPSVNKGEHEHGSRYETAFAHETNGEIEILMQVSSFNYPEAGIIKRILFGSYDEIIKQDRLSRSVDVIAITICLVFALHTFLIWTRKSGDYYLIFAGMAGLMMALYLSVMREQVFYSFWAYNMVIRTIIQTVSIIFISFFLLKFIQYFFTELKDSRIIRGLSIIQLSTLLLLFNVGSFARGSSGGLLPIGTEQLIMALILMVTYTYITVTLFAKIRIRQAGNYILVIASSLFAYWVTLILKAFFEMDQSYVSVILIVIINFSVSLLISDRLQQDAKRIAALEEEMAVRDRLKDDYLAFTATGNKMQPARLLLLADESEYYRDMEKLMLSEGHVLFKTNNVDEALEIIRRENIDLAIIDAEPAGFSGEAVCNSFREEYSMVELPILLILSSERNYDLRHILECNTNDFVNKQSEPWELLSRIRSLLLLKTSYEEGLEKEFRYFYSQLSPHFLYNTLNTVIGLSYSDIESTRKAMNDLGTYLRGKMDFHKTNKLVSLESEMELTRAYLEIELLRYGKRLEVEILGNAYLPCKLPPLTIQPLVENSVRHGINYRDVLKISINVLDKGERAEIIVEDNGPGISDEEKAKLLKGLGEGMGLTNVVRRINLLRSTKISITDGDLGGTRVSILVTKEQEGKQDYEGYISG